MMNRIFYLLCVSAVVGLSGCMPRTDTVKMDYTNFEESRPRSILVLPPKNNSPEVKAIPGVWAQTVLPLSEGGYYVLPVTLVDETFKQNGLTTPNDIHAVPYEKLRKIFGADAALYMTIGQYGTRYAIISSETIVTASAYLVDLKTGKRLWAGVGGASSAEAPAGGGGGIIGALVQSAVRQVLETTTDEAFSIAAKANFRLFWVGAPNGLLAGPLINRNTKTTASGGADASAGAVAPQPTKAASSEASADKAP